MTFTLSTFTECQGRLWLNGRDELGRRRTFVVGAAQRRFWLIVFMERITISLVDDRLLPFPAASGPLQRKPLPAGAAAGSSERPMTYDQ